MIESSTPSALIRCASVASTSSAAGKRSLPSDMMDRAGKRLRALALVYAFVFFMSTFIGSFFEPGSSEFANILDWGPSAISIGMALLVAWMTTRPNVSATTIVNGGLVFQVVGSYGIAMAQYWGVYQGLEHQMAHLDVFGLSWVAVWMMLFAIVVPAKPAKAMFAAVGSASAVPIVMALTMKYGGTSIVLTSAEFFAGLIMPYLLVILMTHVGARAIYSLGREVAKARELGSYHLVDRLGMGGMGEVWRAEHRMLARPAAIKLVRPEVLSGGGEGPAVALKRFEQEAQATALLRSPHTIELFDFGVSGDGAFYYVMELLDGFDLESLVKEFGPMPSARAIPMLRQACDSLAEAHERGLIHRDVKPANVFVCRYGRHVDFVKVMDFGLVKHHGQDQPDIKVTADNVVGGTPSYMSPEQAAGDQELDGRSDIYALGCVAYWMITGQLVFEGTVIRTMMAHMQETPVPPSQRTELEVPPAFEQLVLRCLEKDPDRRPQTADELSALLAECETPGEWSTDKARDWWNKVRPPSPSQLPH